MDSVKLFFDLLGRTQGERDIARFGKAIEDAGDDAERSSKGHRTLAEGTRVLATEMGRAQNQARELRQEFARTGDMSLLKEISKADRDVKRFSGWVKNLGDDSDHTSSKLGLFARMTAAAGEGVATLGTKLASGTGLMNPYVLAALGGVGASTLLAAAATAGGVAITGFGLAAIAAGVKVRSSSAAMEGALSSFGKTASDTLFGASAIIERETLPALGKLESKIHSIGPHLGDIFIGPATAIGPLEQGIEGLIDRALPGLEDAANASSSTLRAVAGELPNLGDVLGGFFSDIASESEGGTNALLTVIHTLEIMVTQIGRAIEGGEKIWSWLENLPGGGLPILEHFAASMSDVHTQNEKVAVSGRTAARAIGDEGATAEIAKNATRSLSEALGLLNFDSLNSAQAQIASATATNRFADALKDGKHALLGNSAAALTSRAAALSALESYAQTADSVTKLTGSTSKGTASFYANVEALRATTPAGSAARAQLDALIATFVQSRGAAERNAGGIASINTQIALLKDKQVLAKARGDASEVARLQHQIDALHGKTVYLTTIQKFGGTAYGSADAAERAANGHAGGGRVLGFAAGGFSGSVLGAGTATSDSIPAMLSNGEYVVRAAAVRRAGLATLDRLNATGSVGGSGGTAVTNNYITINTGADPAAVVAALQKYAQQNNGIRLRGGVRTT